MYKPIKKKESTIQVNNSYEGERIEEKIQRIVNNKEPISDSAPIIYTDRKDGVQAQYNIRTDRWELAVDSMDKVTGTLRAKRESKPTIGEQAMEGMKKENEKPNNGEAKPADTTS